MLAVKHQNSHGEEYKEQ